MPATERWVEPLQDYDSWSFLHLLGAFNHRADSLPEFPNHGFATVRHTCRSSYEVKRIQHIFKRHGFEVDNLRSARQRAGGCGHLGFGDRTDIT